jgi:hypothetical protein
MEIVWCNCTLLSFPDRRASSIGLKSDIILHGWFVRSSWLDDRLVFWTIQFMIYSMLYYECCQNWHLEHWQMLNVDKKCRILHVLPCYYCDDTCKKKTHYLSDKDACQNCDNIITNECLM